MAYRKLLSAYGPGDGFLESSDAQSKPAPLADKARTSLVVWVCAPWPFAWVTEVQFKDCVVMHLH